MVPEIVQVVIVGLMILVPLCVIYKKAGFNPLWAGLVFLPGFGLLIIFMQLALLPWPNAKSGSER
ncbi:MAG: hypothetical protein PHW13_08535 [Methylococcales bacterium]|nr:hypothetical protein [Methylococcales bacterium]